MPTFGFLELILQLSLEFEISIPSGFFVSSVFKFNRKKMSIVSAILKLLGGQKPRI